jgi:PAS domain S-box-containing protein
MSIPPQAPLFANNVPNLSASASQAVAQRGTPATLNLDDIFGDVFFTPDGDTVFMGEQQEEKSLLPSGEKNVANVASRPQGQAFVPVPQAGGLHTTNLDRPGERALAMGVSGQAAPTPAIPFQHPPQQTHHMQFAMPNAPVAPQPAQKKRSRSTSSAASARSAERKMSEQQKVERRERNREHAKRSRIRKKFLLESLQQSVSLLKEENDKLRNSIRSHLGTKEADELLQKQLDSGEVGLIASSSGDANKVLDDPDFSFIKALQTAQQNFVVTDPSLPDNPIVYASQGFLNLTGYTLNQVLGRNCRFLQGPETDPKAVEKIRKSIEEGSDMSVCLLNYRVDGTTFWNQFFIAALRDASGNVTNYVGVQCKVSDQYAANVCKKQQEEDGDESEQK